MVLLTVTEWVPAINDHVRASKDKTTPRSWSVPYFAAASRPVMYTDHPVPPAMPLTPRAFACLRRYAIFAFTPGETSGDGLQAGRWNTERALAATSASV